MSAKPFVFDTDVLIIGGGFSGSWAALTARQHVENVLIVDKGPRDWGGLGGMSGGDMIVKQPEFAAKDLVEELVYYYDGLCEQDVLEEILNQSYERFKDYEKMGHEFARDDSGRLMSIPQRGLELMRYYFYHPYGKGGAHTTQILNAELQRLNVQRIGRIEITDLVKDGDAVSGAVGFHAQSGTPCLFRAKAVILAAHNGGWKGSYLLNTCAGAQLCANRPPLTPDKRLRMVFISTISAPLASSWPVICCSSAPGISGFSNSALPPPDSRNSTVSSAVKPCTSSSAFRVAAKPFSSGTGCPASQQSTPGIVPFTWPYLVTTTPPSTRPRNFTAAWAICHAALPAATSSTLPPCGRKFFSARRTASSGRTAFRLARMMASASLRSVSFFSMSFSPFPPLLVRGQKTPVQSLPMQENAVQVF